MVVVVRSAVCGIQAANFNRAAVLQPRFAGQITATALQQSNFDKALIHGVLVPMIMTQEATQQQSIHQKAMDRGSLLED